MRFCIKGQFSWLGQPKCVRDTFVKGEPLTYYTCTTCAKNWICEACIRSCHGTHQTALHIENYKSATFGLCNCNRTAIGCNLEE